MKKTACVFLFLLLFNIIAVIPLSLADFNQSYQGYLDTYEAYRSASNDYVTTRNQYLQYGTLNAKNDALTAGKKFLLTRDQTLLSYISLLRERITDTSFNPLLDDEEKFLKDHQERIPAVGSLEDAIVISQETEKRQANFLILSKKIVGLIILNKVETAEQSFRVLYTDAQKLIESIKASGKDASTLERWLLDAKNKQLLVEAKITESKNLLTNLHFTDQENLNSEYNKIQFTIFEANQYLKEATSFLNELAESIKYGKY